MPDKVSIRVENVVVGYDAEPILSGASLEVKGGEFVGIVGPNGSGKTTLLRTIARILKPSSGAVLVGDMDVYKTPARTMAQIVGVVPQDTVPAFDFTALEIVLMGRSPHLGRFQIEGVSDASIAEESMRQTGTWHLAERQFAALSGGERQRVVIARALAQQPKVILLDEPTSHLDINYQFEIMNLIKRLNREQGITVLTVLHDLNLAAQYCDKLAMIGGGRVRAIGTPEDVITPQNIKRTYGVDVWVRKHPTSGRPYVIAGISGPSNRRGKTARIHVIGGAGTGAPIMADLLRRGFDVTAGVLHIGDTDQEAADALGIDYVSAPPFTPISEEATGGNLRLAITADFVVVSDAPIGYLNLENLKIAANASQNGTRVILYKPETIGQRDYTDGTATSIVSDMLESAIQAGTPQEIVDIVETAL